MKFAVITKENQVLKRALKKHEITNEFTNHDRLFFTRLLQMNNKLKQYITLVKPETVLKKWRYLSKNRWVFQASRKRGRPQVSAAIRKLIIDMKNNNYMNAHAEKFVSSAKRECFDYFIVFNYMQLRSIMKEYVRYYNNLRPHQGIGNTVPDKLKLIGIGEIRKESVLFGLYTNYYRSAA